MQKKHMILVMLCLLLAACAGSVGPTGTPGADGGVTADALSVDLPLPVQDITPPPVQDGAAPDQQTADQGPCASDPDKSKNKHYWSLGPWSACSATCGQGTRTRTVTCFACNGQAAPPSKCPAPSPPTSQACTATSSCTYSWMTSAWGACSQSCGGGTSTRTVWCQRSDGVKVPNAKCAGAPPAGSTTCNTQGCNTTTCAEMKAWMQCATASYINGIHGDPTSTKTCQASCGSRSARCAKLIDYGNSSVCVCHKVAGVQPSTSPFHKSNTKGYEIFAADCPAVGPAGKSSCKTASCQKTCGAMVAWQQCTGASYFTDTVHGKNTSAAECAKACGKMGASCAKYLKMANGGKTCVCHASAGLATSWGSYAKGNAQGLQIFSASCP